jgi:hypothetical protein
LGKIYNFILRNVLIDGEKELNLKVSDFGMSKITDNNNYYVTQDEFKIPVKW